jgi:hypothetical protein
MRNTILFFFMCFIPFLTPLPALDLDNDGVDDDLEYTLAEEFLPIIYFGQEELCPSPGVLLFHVRPFAPDVDTVLSITYLLLFYDDCGSGGHKGDTESFCLTLYEDPACPVGYRVHSMRTYAHEGAPVCEHTSTVTVNRCDFGASSGDVIFVSMNKHALYWDMNVCNDSDRWYCDDECEDGMVMHDGNLVFPPSAQSWFMYNVGEPDYPFIENLSEINGSSVDFSPHLIWDYGHFCGNEEYSPGDNCPSTIVNKLFKCASGPSLPVEVSYSAGGAVPSPMGYCRDQFLFLNLPSGGNIIAHIYEISGDVADKVFLPYFCPAEELTVPYWDGGDMHGYCASPGNYYIIVEAQRGDTRVQTGEIRFGITGDEGRPRSPSNLEGTGNSSSVFLSWTDRSSIEDAYVVERSFDLCPYRVITILPENTSSYVDNPDYEGLARYRVLAHRTLGGNSSYSNAIALQLQWDFAAPFLRGTEAFDPHIHTLAWHFDPEDATFDRYFFYKRFKIPQGVGCEGGVPPDWSQWFNIHDTSEQFDTVFVDSNLTLDNCYEYKVEAVVNDWADTLISNVRNFHGNCDENGCPVLFLVSGSGERRITNLLPGIEYEMKREPPYKNRVDMVFLGKDIAVNEDTLTLRIEEIGSDTSYLDELRLFSLPRPIDQLSGVRQPGGIVSFKDLLLPISVADSFGRDWIDLVERSDDKYFRGCAADQLVLEFDRGAGTDSLLGFICPKGEPPMKAFGPRLLLWDDGAALGKWREICTLNPHQNSSVYLVNLSPYIMRGQASIRIKLEWIKALSIDCIFLTSEFQVDAGMNELELVRALSDDGLDVTEKVGEEDGISAILENNESVRLYYLKPGGPDKAMEFDYYLKVTGYYVKGEPCEN